MINTICSYCGSTRDFEDKYLGKKFKCPNCNNTVLINSLKLDVNTQTQETENNEIHINNSFTPKRPWSKKNKINLYWIYGLIFICLLVPRFFQLSPDIATTSELEFKQIMLLYGDVELLDFVANKNIVRVYIKPDSVEKDFYVQKFKSKLSKEKVKGVPLFEFSVTDWNSFNERLQRFYEQKNIKEVPHNTTIER
jgi:DNA-directed RNA polymerase subunit RPC12/RpoP